MTQLDRAELSDEKWVLRDLSEPLRRVSHTFLEPSIQERLESGGQPGSEPKVDKVSLFARCSIQCLDEVFHNFDTLIVVFREGAFRCLPVDHSLNEVKCRNDLLLQCLDCLKHGNTVFSFQGGPARHVPRDRQCVTQHSILALEQRILVEWILLLEFF